MSRSWFYRSLFYASALALSWGARAANFVNIVPNVSSAPEIVQTELTNMFTQLETQVNDQFPDTDPAAFAQNTANAMALAGGGLGTEYATPFSIASVGGSVGLGLDLGGRSFSQVFSSSQKDLAKNLPGFGAQGGVVVGFNLGRFWKKKFGPVDMSRTKVWVNWFSSSINRLGVTAGTTTFGFHVQYKLLTEKAVPFGLVKWYGLDVGTGYHYAKMNLGINQTLALEQAQDISGFGSVTTLINGTGSVSAVAKNSTIPIEVSTGARLLYVLSLYTGLGMDMNFGSTSIAGDMNATVSLKNAPSQLQNVSATADMNDVTGKKGPSFFALRGFAGLQFDAGVANLFLQVSKNFTGRALGALVGARLYW